MVPGSGECCLACSTCMEMVSGPAGIQLTTGGGRMRHVLVVGWVLVWLPCFPILGVKTGHLSDPS
jgi:hypothetical protein